MIRELVDTYDQAFPSVLEIPSKDHPYGKYRTAVTSVI
jgi:vacuolar-type H+-ATPase subunit F/Vma7